MISPAGQCTVRPKGSERGGKAGQPELVTSQQQVLAGQRPNCCRSSEARVTSAGCKTPNPGSGLAGSGADMGRYRCPRPRTVAGPARVLGIGRAHSTISVLFCSATSFRLGRSRASLPALGLQEREQVGVDLVRIDSAHTV